MSNTGENASAFALFLKEHGGTVIVAIGGVFASIITWFSTKTSTVGAMQKTLQEGFEALNNMQAQKIAALENEITSLRGRVRSVEQLNLSLISLLRKHGIDLPQSHTTEVVFAPFPEQKDGTNG